LSLPKFKAYIKLMIEWVVSDPFSMKTFPLPEPENGPEIKEKVRKQTRQAYAMHKKRIEKLISYWANQTFNPVDKAVKKASFGLNNDKKWNIVEKIEDLEKNVWYDAVVKLKYNYGLFVVLNWWKVEWLLHKKKIKVPDWIKRKDMYQIWDKIKVKFDVVKEINWETRIEFTQL